MAPYSPPSGGRAGKLRLDFNENTVGCSPRVIDFLKSRLCEQQLSIYPEYTRVKPALAAVCDYQGLAKRLRRRARRSYRAAAVVRDVPVLFGSGGSEDTRHRLHTGD